MFAGGCFMFFVAADIEQAAMDFWMKRFDPPIQHFRKPRVGA